MPLMPRPRTLSTITEAVVQRFDTKFIPEPNSGCWLWVGSYGPKGYGQFSIGKYLRAHRASWMIHRGAIPNGLFVCHTCDVRCCVNPDHLFLGTPSDNARDMHRKGRASLVRSKQPRQRPYPAVRAGTKLTPSDVLAIRASTERSIDLAQRLGVSKSTINMVRNGRNWRSIQGGH